MLNRINKIKDKMKEQLTTQWFNLRFVFFQPSKCKQLDVSFIMHWAKFLLKTKISSVNHIFKGP